YKPQVGQCLLVAGVLSVVLAVFCLFLPHTPPSKEAKNPFAFLGSFKLMSNPSFAVLIVVAFLVSTELQFYYVLTPGFFNESGGPFTAKEMAGTLQKASEQRVEAGALVAAAPLLPKEELPLDRAEAIATDMIAAGD